MMPSPAVVATGSRLTSHTQLLQSQLVTWLRNVPFLSFHFPLSSIIIACSSTACLEYHGLVFDLPV